MFIFHLEYFLSCKNFCKDDKKKYFLQNNTVCVFIKKLMEPPFSECLALLKTEIRYSYSFILNEPATSNALTPIDNGSTKEFQENYFLLLLFKILKLINKIVIEFFIKIYLKKLVVHFLALMNSQ